MTSCPRCNGHNVISDRDHYGAYQKCISCGWYEYSCTAPEVVPKTVAAQVRQTHKKYVFEKKLYMKGAPMPRRKDFTNVKEQRALYRRWYWWNVRKETA